MEKFLKDLTKQAGNYLLCNFKKDKNLIGQRTTSKEAATMYDKISDKMIIKEIEKKYPLHSILTEESGMHDKKSNYLWIVDSLDGTSNFANGNPLFSVCIALMHKNKLQSGAIFAPAIDEFYFAKKGKGAYLNGKKIKVSNVPRMEHSYFLFCEGGDKTRQKAGRIADKIFLKVTDLRKIGSGGIETAWVACGKVDGYFTTDIYPWDMAPGVLLVEEAGGKVTDYSGKPWTLAQSDLLFTNKKIHQEAMNVIK